jgi:hypothetical protein
VESEISNSKSEIEDRLGERVSSFCYPFAFPQANRAFTQTLRAMLRKAGYTCCLTTQVGVDRGDDPFCIKRLPVNSLDDVQLFASKLAGAYDWIAWPQQTVKWCKAMLKFGS